MRVPEISLGYGLLAQNKHDLCRYYKYTERHKQTQYLPAYTVSFMVVPSVRAWEFRVRKKFHAKPLKCWTRNSSSIRIIQHVQEEYLLVPIRCLYGNERF